MHEPPLMQGADAQSPELLSRKTLLPDDDEENDERLEEDDDDAEPSSPAGKLLPLSP